MARFEKLGYQPSLDGLRGVALLGVIAYHAGIEGFRGGFLGVSSFFTLSGFLITSLLLVERSQSGSIDLPSFWARRLRRLLPAALVTIVATVVLATSIADDSQLARLRIDALASLFHFSNWRFIAEGDSYGALFESPSFFRHFWSLAVEEQYYVVFPLALAGSLRIFGGPSRRFVVAFGVASAAALAWPAFLLHRGASVDRLYFGTDTRLAEMVVGAMLALWWVRRGREPRRAPWWLTAAAIGAILVIGVMWATANPSDRFLYQGGLALHAALTLLVIIVAIAPSGPVATVLAFEPVRRLGVVSYGAYLIHWPVLLWLEHATTFGPVTRFAAASVVTVLLATLSHLVVERPIRRMPTGRVRRHAWLAIPASLTVAVAIVALTALNPPTTRPTDFAAAEAVLDELPRSEPNSLNPAPASSRPVRLAAFGDSTALMTGIGLLHWAEDHPEELTMVQGDARLGCGLVSGGTRRLEDREIEVPDECDGWMSDWPDKIDEGVDVSLVQLGAWEIVDHRLDPEGPFLAIARDRDYEALQLEQLDEAVHGLLEHSEMVALIAHPDVGRGRIDRVPAGISFPEYDLARSERWREMVREYASVHPDVVVVDLAAWIDGNDDDDRLRPDGVHFTSETADEVAEWLAPEILRANREIRGRGDVVPTPPDRPPSVTKVLLVGDSLAADTAPALRAAIETAAESVSMAFEVFPAIPRGEEGMYAWGEAATVHDPDIVIIYVGWWESAAAATIEPPIGEPGFEASYRSTVLAPWFDRLRDADIETIYVGMAPTRNRTGGGEQPSDRIAAVVAAARAEAAVRDDVHFVASSTVLAPDGFVDVLPDSRTGVPERVRRVDGVHLCPDGAERVVDLVVDRLRRLTALTVSDAWRLGPWRFDTPVDLALECPPVG